MVEVSVMEKNFISFSQGENNAIQMAPTMDGVIG